MRSPEIEQYALTSQIRRAAASIPADIAEGCGRFESAELHRFVQIAMGSLSELDYHLLLARDLGFLEADQHTEFYDRVHQLKRMLVAFARKIDSERRSADDS